MSSSPENFDELRKLLALKQHEQPPPGYFHQFSTRVMGRIEATELLIESSWWERFLTNFDAKPVLVCAYSLLVCGGLLLGLSFFQMIEGDSSSALSPIASSLPNQAGLPRFVNMTDSSWVTGSPRLTAEPPTASMLFDGTGLKVERASYFFGRGY